MFSDILDPIAPDEKNSWMDDELTRGRVRLGQWLNSHVLGLRKIRES